MGMIVRKGEIMSRNSKIMLFPVLLVFVLACNFVTQPIQDVENLASTAESVATAFPIETLQALPSALPVETLEAIPSSIPEIGNYYDPQGEPVAEWNGIPIMPQAETGQEFDGNNYSFKYTGTVQEAVDFYTSALGTAGWSPMITVPGDEQSAMLIYQREDAFLTITFTRIDDKVVVWLSTL
jgi:hypothetical protein